jgi:outer membrane receptor protein involved in Fe transport
MVRIKRMLAASSLGLFALPGIAAAEEASNTGTYLEEVIVTATKREESVQDIPIAVTAINERQIERAGVKDIRDLPLLAPSFNMLLADGVAGIDAADSRCRHHG